MPALIVIGLIVFGVYQCAGGAFYTDKLFGPPSSLPFSRYEEMKVGVYFTRLDGRTDFLGTTTGASLCGAMAHGHARALRIEATDWNYSCCAYQGGSDCIVRFGGERPFGKASCLPELPDNARRRLGSTLT